MEPKARTTVSGDTPGGGGRGRGRGAQDVLGERADEIQNFDCRLPDPKRVAVDLTFCVVPGRLRGARVVDICVEINQ